MSSLMDRINKGMSQQPARQPQIGQEQIQSVLKAKGGKAQTGAGIPQASAMLQQSARQQAQSQLRQQGMAGELAKTQLGQQFAQQEQKVATAEQQLDFEKEQARANMKGTELAAARARDASEAEARSKRSFEENIRMDQLQSNMTMQLRELSTQRDITLDNIFAEQKRSEQALEDRADAAELEQMAFNLALSDRAYMDEIDRIGRERMLYDQLSFQEETARLTLGDDLNAARDQMDWGRAFNAQRREWEIEIAKLDLNSALEVARAEIKQQNQRMMWQGIGDLASAGARAGTAYMAGGFDSGGNSGTDGYGGQTGSDSLNTMPGILS